MDFYVIIVPMRPYNAISSSGESSDILPEKKGSYVRQVRKHSPILCRWGGSNGGVFSKTHVNLSSSHLGRNKFGYRPISTRPTTVRQTHLFGWVNFRVRKHETTRCYLKKKKGKSKLVLWDLLLHLRFRNC